MELLPALGILLVVAVIIYFVVKKKIESNIINVEKNVSEVLLCNFEGDLPFGLSRYKDDQRQSKLVFREYVRTHVDGSTSYRRRLDVLVFVDLAPDQSSGWCRKATFDLDQ